MTRLVVVDADTLGRRRTGDERYVANLLRELAPLVAQTDLRLAAVTRHPELLPPGVEPLVLTTAVQELRMLWTLPRLLRRAQATLVHTQYALPAGAVVPGVVTIHDLSFERDPRLMPWKDRFLFRRVVPRAARRARRVLTVSERTKRDLVELYGLPAQKVVVTPNGVDPAFSPRNGSARERTYALAVGAIQPRKNQLAALAAATAAGMPLVVAGPIRDEALASRLRAGGAELRGYVPQDELVELLRGAACLVQASRFEGFGLPVLEAMACGTPVVAVDEPALREVAADAAVIVAERELAAGIQRALAAREELRAAGLRRAQAFSWRATAERTLDVYLEAMP